MRNITDFIFQARDESKILTCSCGARFSSKLGRCPSCGIVYETEEEKKNWGAI